jgi:hypothetical protein
MNAHLRKMGLSQHHEHRNGHSIARVCPVPLNGVMGKMRGRPSHSTKATGAGIAIHYSVSSSEAALDRAVSAANRTLCHRSIQFDWWNCSDGPESGCYMYARCSRRASSRASQPRPPSFEIAELAGPALEDSAFYAGQRVVRPHIPIGD